MEINDLEILEIGPTINGIAQILGNGCHGAQTFGFSISYDVRSRKFVGKTYITPKRFYIGQILRKELLPIIEKENLT